jgi:integrase
MATFTRRGDGQWQVKIRRRGYPAITKTFSTKAKAEYWARSVESEMDGGTFVSRAEAETTTLKEALQRYLSEITPFKKGARQENDRIKVWMSHDLASRYLANLRSVDFAQYRDQKLAAGAGASTIRNHLNIISHLFTIARKEWGMESLQNPIQNIRMPKQPPGRERRLESHEESMLLHEAEYPLRHLIILALETGMRLGELLGMRWENINLKKSVVVLVETKNGERRVVPLSSKAKEVIISLPRHIEGWLFPGLSSSNVSHRFADLCKRNKISGLRFHDLRHEATSRLFERGLDMMEVASITGHKTLHMLRRYTHLKAEDLARKLG